MNEDLVEFVEKYGDDATRISKYKKYREQFGASIVFGILLLIATQLSQYSALFGGFPFSPYLQYIPGGVLLLIALILYLGKRDIGVTTEDVALHEMALAIKSMDSNDADSTLNHIEELKDEFDRSGNNLVSEKTIDRLKEYHIRLEESENPENILQDSFEPVFTNILEELNKGDELSDILNQIPSDSNDEFEGSVLLDSLTRLKVDFWSLMAILVLLGSVLLFNIVGKDMGFYVAVILLSAIQILSDRRD